MPTRRTLLGTTSAVGGAVVAGGVIGGSLMAGPEEAVAAEAAPCGQVPLTVNGTRRASPDGHDDHRGVRHHSGPAPDDPALREPGHGHGPHHVRLP